MRRSGFTLVEMLVALTLFGLLTAAGVTLLGVTLRSQASADRQLALNDRLRNLGALLDADLALAAPRPHRSESGARLPAFSGGGRDLFLLLVRQGVDAGEGAEPRRVGYRLSDGRIERLAFVRLDGSGAARAVTLLDGVTGLSIRFRDPDGEWRERWDPTDLGRLPRAAELAFDSRDHGRVRMLFLTGTSGR